MTPIPLALALLLAVPHRIVSTTPSITEILYALGLGDRVAGVTTYCRYPPEAARKPKIGAYVQPNLEAIAALSPDLVIIQKNPVQLRARLERLNLKVLELEYDSVPQTLDAIRSIGAATGAPEAAQRLARQLAAELDRIRALAAARPRRSMAFIIGRHPGAIDGLIAVGRASYLTDLMDLAGGSNVFAGAPAAYPKVTLEEMLARNPDVIVDMGDMSNPSGVTEAQRQAVLRLWDRYPSLRAVRHNRVFVVADDMFVVPGPRMVDAARSFARMLARDRP